MSNIALLRHTIDALNCRLGYIANERDAILDAIHEIVYNPENSEILFDGGLPSEVGDMINELLGWYSAYLFKSKDSIRIEFA